MLKLAFFLPNSSGYQDRIDMLKKLSCDGIDVTLIIGLLDRDIPSGESGNFRVVSVGFSPGNRIINLLKTYWVLKRLHKMYEFDVIHDTYGNFLIYFFTTFRKSTRPVYVSSFYALEKWRIENVWRPSGRNRFHLLFRKSTLRTFIGEFIQSTLSKICDHVVLQAPGLVERLLMYEDMAPSKVSVLVNSVDVNYWKPTNKQDELSSSGNGLLKILYIPQRAMDGLDSTLEIRDVLACVSRLEALGIDVSMTIIVKSGSQQMSEISRVLRDEPLCNYKIVLKHGLSRDQMKETYNSSDLMIYQTVNDGSPRVVIEALACGLPVLCNPHPGICVLDEHHQYLQFAQYGSIDSITSQLQKMNNMKFLSDISIKGRSHVEINFSNEFAAKSHASFYKKVTNIGL